MKYTPLLALALLSTPLKAEDWSLVWSDMFDTETLSKDWHIIEGNGCPSHCGFGNNEKQTYTGDTKNLRLENGALIIEAHPEADGSFSSAKITTENSVTWTYGKIEARAKLPTGVGSWPAVWMMPKTASYGPWPKSGEIDIMEHVGYNQNHVHGTIHTEAYNHRIGTQKGGEIVVDTSATEFHTYGIEWGKGNIRWFVDGEEYFRFDRETDAGTAEWPFDHPFYLIMNFAVGGDWGGAKGIDQAAFPARLEIDWVKVWQKQ